MALQRLERSDYHIADGNPDIRGWSVMDASGTSLGTIDGLLFDDNTRRVVYGIVEGQNRKVLVPVGDLDINESGRNITARGYTQERFTSLRAYDGSMLDETTERTHYQEHVPSFKATDKVDYAAERFSKDVPQHIRLLEEQVRLGKRSNQVGEVVAQKRVVTDTVSESISLEQDRVDVQRRAVNEPARAGEVIGSDTEVIRVPLFAEEAVIEKRPVVKEEITINKHTEARTETVREEVRREELAFAGTEPTVDDTVKDRGIVGQDINRTKNVEKTDIDIIPDERL